MLSWEPVADADTYRVFVRGADEEEVWAWTGSSASVLYGAPPESMADLTDALGTGAEATAQPNVLYVWSVSAWVDGERVADAMAAFRCDATCSAEPLELQP